MIRKLTSLSSAANPGAALSKLLGAAVLSATAAIVPAQAEILKTITFDNFAGPAGDSDYILEAGFYAAFYSNTLGAMPGDYVGNFFNGADSTSCTDGLACPVNNATTYYGALNDSLINIGINGPGDFKVKSFDASFIGGTPVANTTYPALSGLLRIQGFFADGGTAYETYALNGPTGDAFNFAHFNTSAAFGNLSFAQVYVFGFACETAGGCNAFSNDRAQFALDNVTLAVVPEPSSFLLLGLGLAGMGAMVRRRKNSL